MSKTLALAALASVVVACGGPSSVPPPETQPPVAVPPPSSSPMDLPPADAGVAPTAAAAATEATLTDEQIAKIGWTIDQGEIDAAKLAATNAKDPKVKKFAAMMIKHHTEDQKKGEAMAKKDKMTPADSPISTDLKNQNETTATMLKGLKGAEFDKAYMDAMVKGHTAAADLFQTKLIPGAKNADLKAALTAFKPTVDMHLKDAQEIQAGLK